nr:uncharacterized protein LOC127314040 [Lolium perenne]
MEPGAAAGDAPAPAAAAPRPRAPPSSPTRAPAPPPVPPVRAAPSPSQRPRAAGDGPAPAAAAPQPRAPPTRAPDPPPVRAAPSPSERSRAAKKKKSGIVGSSIHTMWEKAAKTRKMNESSTPNQTTTASSVESNLQMVLWQAPESREETSTPHVEVEDDESIDEDDEMMQADLEALEHDPGKRIPISMYDVNDQDRVRRRFIEMGPCQPKNHKFEFTNKGGRERRFSAVWFKDFPWIEYSVEKERAFCFVCYLFKDKTRCPGGDAFVKKGFNNWNMKKRLKKHEGEVSSAHAEAQEKYDRFNSPQTSIRESIASNTTQYKALYKQRLTWTLKCVRYLLHQGLAFRGHDESEDSLNKGNG